ncbi:hypothetical protein M409DRAFT_15981 [Zasmidium cellare ATCC 36951]|uniref:F-box domain-containing protein n=1 Tax=Zasmidium cellare ATCC 36951 TaxID=1080233 RepID=A0A6A6D2R2_ZASCE|nr:uncharacterized protein M409DRAFT_15981 [Zasmidium cellare ATCC 36951]KAF2173707.1 hypothetical protein M409DRAFT_15981 [Zasmidium cellare ATCC 36951]
MAVEEMDWASDSDIESDDLSISDSAEVWDEYEDDEDDVSDQDSSGDYDDGSDYYDGYEGDDEDEFDEDEVEVEDSEHNEAADHNDEDDNDDEEDRPTMLLSTQLALRPKAVPRGRFRLPTLAPFNHTKNQKRHLLTLPAEIRNEIWHFALVPTHDISIGSREPIRNLITVNKQIHHEALDIFYEESTFTLGLYKTIRTDIHTINAKIKELMSRRQIPLVHIRNFSITLAISVEEHYTGLTTTSFFRLAVHRAQQNVLITLHTIPGFYEDPARESCVCDLLPLVAALRACDFSLFGVIFQASLVFPTSMYLPVGEVCGECGKRKLCYLNWSLLGRAVAWWRAAGRFMGRVREMRGGKKE